MKRTSMQRKAPLSRQDGKARLAVPVKRKAKTCPECKNSFIPTRAIQPACNTLECSISYADKVLAKSKAKLAKEERRDHREKLADSKKLSHWLALTERVAHAYIHVRDRGLPCISCGTTSTVQWEAGHWLTKGARPELRFVAEQINLQCHRCNVQLSGNQAAYRLGLVLKIGEARVKELEGPHPPTKFTREALAAIRKEFAAATRQLEKING